MWVGHKVLSTSVLFSCVSLPEQATIYSPSHQLDKKYLLNFLRSNIFSFRYLKKIRFYYIHIYLSIYNSFKHSRLSNLETNKVAYRNIKFPTCNIAYDILIIRYKGLLLHDVHELQGTTSAHLVRPMIGGIKELYENGEEILQRDAGYIMTAMAAEPDLTGDYTDTFIKSFLAGKMPNLICMPKHRFSLLGLLGTLNLSVVKAGRLGEVRIRLNFVIMKTVKSPSEQTQSIICCINIYTTLYILSLMFVFWTGMEIVYRYLYKPNSWALCKNK